MKGCKLPCQPVHVLDHLAMEWYDDTLVRHQESLTTTCRQFQTNCNRSGDWKSQSEPILSIYLSIYVDTGHPLKTMQKVNSSTRKKANVRIQRRVCQIFNRLLGFVGMYSLPNIRPIQKSPHRSQLKHSAPQPACQSATADSCGTVNRRHPCRPGTRCSAAAARSTCYQYHRSTTKS